MTERHIQREPTAERKTQYTEMEISGESQRALWAVIATLADQGIDIGVTGRAVLDKRARIKVRAPK